ncbi:MAG TPA: hypothetical protein VFM35_09040, partial [Candidatus Binatia bacterium]|nr:hypothetical protein [Candidatus Binatia bacterium]
GPFSAMKGQLPRALTLEEHKALGLNAAWYTFIPDLLLKASAWSFLQAFRRKGIAAWYEFLESHPDTPFTGGTKWEWDGGSSAKLQELERKYSSKKIEVDE